jgi:hypothetical protein
MAETDQWSMRLYVSCSLRGILWIPVSWNKTRKISVEWGAHIIKKEMQLTWAVRSGGHAGTEARCWMWLCLVAGRGWWRTWCWLAWLGLAWWFLDWRLIWECLLYTILCSVLPDDVTWSPLMITLLVHTPGMQATPPRDIFCTIFSRQFSQTVTGFPLIIACLYLNVSEKTSQWCGCLFPHLDQECLLVLAEINGM